MRAHPLMCRAQLIVKFPFLRLPFFPFSIVAMGTTLNFHSLSSSCFCSEARERETLISDAKTQPLGREEGHGGVCSQDTGSQPLLQQRQVDSSILHEDLIKSQPGPALVQHSGSMDHQDPIVACPKR